MFFLIPRSFFTFFLKKAGFRLTIAHNIFALFIQSSGPNSQLICKFRFYFSDETNEIFDSGLFNLGTSYPPEEKKVKHLFKVSYILSLVVAIVATISAVVSTFLCPNKFGGE